MKLSSHILSYNNRFYSVSQHVYRAVHRLFCTD